MKRTIYLLAALLFISFSSCKKDAEVASAKFSMKQKTTTLKATQIGTFTFSKANFGISEIEFEMEFENGPDDNEFEVEYEGPFQFDVLTGTSTPAINAIEITPGTYHELEFDIETVLSTGNSIEIFGTYDDGTSFQFEFTSTFEDEFEIENKLGIDVNIGLTTNFALHLDLALLFNGVDFSTAVVDNDNIIRINSGNNENLNSIIENNLDDIMDLYEEHDDDDDDDDD